MTNTFQFEINANNIARLIFDLPNEKVNTISPEVLDALEEQLDTLAKNRAIRALMITSAKKDSFIAGANLKGFDAVFHQKGAAEKLIGGGHRVFNKLSSLPFPTIAVIDGTCLGGGLELALACNYRVVSDNSKALLGLPETQLGIIPGWGGTQRLPRLIGIEQALGMILSGKPVNAQKALKIKIVDAIFPKEFINEKAEDFAEYCLASENQKAIAKKREQTGWRSTLMESNFIGRYLLFSMARRNVLALTKGHYPAPLVALDLIKRTYTKPLAQGLKEEISTFIAAIPDEFRNAPNLIHVFFASEEVKKNPDLPPGAQAKKIESAAVIGAGTMGAGIVWLFTNSDIPVRFKDVSWAAIGKGYGVIRQIYQKMLKSRKLRSEEMSRKFLLASGTIDYTGFSHVDLVIEAGLKPYDIVALIPIIEGAGGVITVDTIEQSLDKAAVRYDRDGDQHYDVISAFIKSVRGSDVDAALHYLARMLTAGEDPRFIARRLMILASEDIGIADPTALPTAVAAAQTVQLIGLPEAQLTLAHATVHLATAPKSNAVTVALGAAMADIKAGKAGLVPTHLRDGHYAGAAALGHAQGYKYAHDHPGGVAAQQYPPDELVGVDYYRPTPYGAEREIGGRLEKLRAIIRRGRR